MREFILHSPDSDHAIRAACHCDTVERRGRLCALLNQLPSRITDAIVALDDSDGILTVEWNHPPGELDTLTIEALWDRVFGQGADSARHLAPERATCMGMAIRADWTGLRQ